jgi:hypothetical protein
MMTLRHVPLHIWRTHVLKTLGAALVLASGLAVTAAPAFAMQTVVTQVDKNPNGTLTYHFAVKLAPGETLSPGESTATADFVTIYNFYGLVDSSVKSPPGWVFSSEASGRTPAMNGYPLVLPVDVPNTPNLTWTVTKPITGARCPGRRSVRYRREGGEAGGHRRPPDAQLPGCHEIASPNQTPDDAQRAAFGAMRVQRQSKR